MKMTLFCRLKATLRPYLPRVVGWWAWWVRQEPEQEDPAFSLAMRLRTRLQPHSPGLEGVAKKQQNFPAQKPSHQIAMYVKVVADAAAEGPINLLNVL